MSARLAHFRASFGHDVQPARGRLFAAARRLGFAVTSRGSRRFSGLETRFRLPGWLNRRPASGRANMRLQELPSAARFVDRMSQNTCLEVLSAAQWSSVDLRAVHAW